MPKIFTKETYLATQSYIQNRTFFPVITGYSPIISGFSQGFPLLHGYIATLPKNTAEISLSSDRMDPVLAEWQYGLGRVIAWTSDLRGAWTEDWLQWEQAQDFWLNVISRILPSDDGSQGLVQTSRAGDTGTVEVTLGENLDETLDSKAMVVGPDGSEQEINLNVTEPGKYKGDFDVSTPGVYLVRVEQWKNGKIVNTLDTGLAVTYSPEYDIRQSGSREILERIVNQAGGEILDTPNQVFEDDLEPVWTQTEIWPGLLILALILFIFDIVIRRLNLRMWKGRSKSKISAASEGFYRRSDTQPLVTDNIEVSIEAITKEKEKPSQPGSEKQEGSSSLSSQLLNARRESKRKKL
ncbi:MAG: glutamine amidotransferase [Acetivibrionales bacterium]